MGILVENKPAGTSVASNEQTKEPSATHSQQYSPVPTSYGGQVPQSYGGSPVPTSYGGSPVPTTMSYSQFPTSHLLPNPYLAHQVCYF